jgi:hypothetical protein
MRPILLAAVFLSSLAVLAAPPVAPIATAEELRAAAADVPVAEIDITLGKDAENFLSKRFFNQPEERRYAGLTTDSWEERWVQFSTALVEKAKAVRLDSASLETCLRALNRGRNRQTMLWPIEEQVFDLPGQDEAAVAAKRKEAKLRYEAALAERDKNPEAFFDDDLAIVPVGAYLARHVEGRCWIIVCKWEYMAKDQPLPLGHIMIWAVDLRSQAVVAYVTCD